MKKNTALFFALFIFTHFMAYGSSWQAVTVSDTVVNFGNVSTEQTQRYLLTLYNNEIFPVQIIVAAFEENVFSTDLSAVEIPANSSYEFHIYFNSQQNLNYTDFLRIELNAGIHPLIIETTAQATYNDNYYDSTQNKKGGELKSVLHDIIKGHSELDYGDLWDALRYTDEDPNNTNNVLLLYSGWSYSKTNNGGNVDEWNREHVWAKSHGDFGTRPPAGTDLHHIRPTDVSVNSKRGSLDFDDGGTLYMDGNGNTGCYYDGDSWEPRNAVKGDVARMMYYMVVRYEGEEGYDLELVDYTPSTSNNAPIFGKQSTLYQWHQNDPVDDWERRRNDRIYNSYQHNRNPFIDHPEFAERLPSLSGIPIIDEPEIAAAPSSVDMGEIGLNQTAFYYIALINTGTMDLNIRSISSTNPDFTPNVSSMTITPETFQYLQIKYAGSDNEGAYSTTIRLLSNDPDEEQIDIPVQITVNGSVSIVDEETLSHKFRLEQNFPNPFNPSTTIRYIIGTNHQSPLQHVELIIYDILGRRIQTLVNESQMPGSYKVIFDGKNLPAGIYTYKLSAGNQRQIKRMILLK